MGKKKSNPFGRPYNFLAPQDQTPNKPMLPHLDTTMQAYYNPGSIPNTVYNHLCTDSPYMYHQLQNQANNAPLQCDALHDPTGLSYNPHVAEDAAQAFSEMVHRRNPDFNKLFARNSQPDVSLMTGESNDRDGTSMSIANGRKRSTEGDQDDSNKDSPLSKKQKSNIISGDENPSGLAQNLGTVVKESESEYESDSDTDIDVDMQEYEELFKKRDTLKEENSVLTQRLAKLSEKCLELTNENDSLEEELVKMYGPESIADLLPMKPT